jgi:hypothetical protein
MPEGSQIPAELVPWMEETRLRVEFILSRDSPDTDQQRFDELAQMANQFLSLAKAFVEMAETANRFLSEMQREKV